MVTMTAESLRSDGNQLPPSLSRLRLSLPFKALKAWLSLAEQEHCKFVAADHEGHYAYQLYMNHMKQDLFHLELKFLKTPVIQLLEDAYEVSVDIEEVVDVAEETEEKYPENGKVNNFAEEQRLLGVLPKLVRLGRNKDAAAHSPEHILSAGDGNGHFSKWSLGQAVCDSVKHTLPTSTSTHSVPTETSRHYGQYGDYNRSWPQDDGPLDLTKPVDLSKPVKQKDEVSVGKVIKQHEMVENLLKPDNLLNPENLIKPEAYPQMAALAYQQWALQASNPLAFTFPSHVMNSMNKPFGSRPRGRGRPPGRSSSNCRSLKQQHTDSKEFRSSLPRNVDSAIVSSTQRQLGASRSNSLSPQQHGGATLQSGSDVAGTSAVQRPQSPQLSQYVTYASFLQSTINNTSSLDTSLANSSTSCGTLDSASDEEITDRRTNRSFIHRPRDRGKAILRSRQIRHEMGCVMSYLKQLLPPEMRYGRTMFQATILELSTDYITELQKQEREFIRCLEAERKRHQGLLVRTESLKKTLYGSHNNLEVGKESEENFKDKENS